ncbi:MAG: hypothetical protein GWN99_11335 [Gemmatimonadetes bacterium]|uniref:AMP-activated protein kinase glycogen-binding domain-containing protein n=1 Tax=Candidatus Kutchimonas denitrificans TaxID=3056748 RepID=A0AAE4Z8E2_9BACT|nr:hypothetical protein [Gemmatimonadota bacterium]NIR74076.1 hypothetical protein [Candidatus Kutchimonas denitrificans]NIS01638.1 hypothetical protein [Gemmatimonadota bacterium]NIT67376.1 hypothetical protein [Gemmatimonadota bacterium]NIU52739.1 hypothetical protein [Gemmatimonadota bacterium]
MRAWCGAFLALLLVPAAAESGRSQVRVSLGAGAGREYRDSETSAAALLVQPRLSLIWGGTALDFEGGLARFGGGELTARASGTAGWQALGNRFLGLQLGLDAEGAWYEERGGNGLLLGTARISLSNERAGAWLGGGVGAADAGSGFSGLRALEVGGRIEVGGVSVGLSAGQRAFQRRVTTIRDSVLVLPPDTVVPIGRFEVTESTPHSYADGELTLGWSRGPVSLELAIGGRVGNSLVPTERWARVDGFVTLAPTVMAVFSAGRTPGRPERGLSSQPHFLLGLNLAVPGRHRAAAPPTPPRPGLQVISHPSGARVIRIPIDGARRVELMGDFTNWRPLEMEPAGPGFWRLKLHLEPGLYRINIRVDGGPWIVPPGLTPVPDEFSGAVGQLVID